MKKTKSTRTKKDPNVYPPGWDLRKTKTVASYYETRKNQPLVDDDVVEQGSMAVWMEVPQDLVDQVRKLIARHRKSA